jgi:hypothetical protein
VFTVKEGTLTAALEKADLSAAATALRHDVVFHSPILATVADEVLGHSVVVKALGTALAYMGPPRNVEECRNPDGRYIVTFDGVIDGNLIQIAMRVTEDAANKVESLRAFARPWPIVKLFREYMERNLRPDRVPDAMGASGNCIVKVKGRCWAARAGMTEPGTATPHAATSTSRSKCSKGRTGADERDSMWCL